MSQAGQLKIHTDGASRGNPGPAAFAFVIARDGQPPIEQAGRLDDTTNNQAEYTALVRALEHALTLGAGQRVTLHSDSELIVKQMNGQYRVKDAGLKPLYEEADRLRRRFTHPVKFVHVRREANTRADELCNMALDGRLPSGPTPTSAPVAARDDTVHQRGIALLTEAAATWARGNAADPSPQVVWGRLWDMLHHRGVWLPRGGGGRVVDEEE
jgi:ribonuclease HI